jgi:AraC-like DNA-binding protein
VQDCGHDLQVEALQRPAGLRAGFHALVDDTASGLVHAGEQWAPANFLITEHTHPVWEFYLQMHGVTRWTAAGELYVLNPGHFFAVAPNVEHHMASESATSQHFYFAAIDIRRPIARHDVLTPHWPEKVIHRAGAEALADPFGTLMRELTVDTDYTDTGLLLAVDRLFLEVSRAVAARPQSSRLAVHPAVRRVRDLLDRHYAWSWTLAELADRVGLAPTYLAGLFTAETGIPPLRYLAERRIERAKQLLRASDLAITAIGRDTGFGSSQHFARVFRRHTGQAPRDYRRSARPT